MVTLPLLINRKTKGGEMKKRLIALRFTWKLSPLPDQDKFQKFGSFKEGEFVGYLVEDIKFIHLSFHMYLVVNNNDMFFVIADEVQIEENKTIEERVAAIETALLNLKG